MWDARTRSYRLDVDGKTEGRFVGVVVSYPDEKIFEAWRYLANGPVQIDDGNLHRIDQALALFYRRQQVEKPPPGWLRARFMR